MKTAIPLMILAMSCLAACGGGGGTTSPGPGGGGGSGGGGGGEDTEEPTEPRTVTVEMRGIAFNAPGGGNFLTIGLGERVRWVNRDGTAHTATSTEVPLGGRGSTAAFSSPATNTYSRPE